MILGNGRYYYHSDSNTILNIQTKSIFLRHCGKRKILHQKIDISKEKIKKSLRDLKQVTFEMTQHCTLHCKYCVYASGQYKYQRNESEKALDFQNAKKVIDYLWNLIGNRPNKTFTIGFFGGEPLMEFNNIKRIVRYSRTVFKEWKILFTITTNGVLLNKAVNRYLVDNAFSVFISLDGDRENHDSKRTFKNGKGSFNVIMKNIEWLKLNFPAYYRDNIFFSAVYSKDLPFNGVSDFYNSNPLVRKNFMSLSFVNTLDSTYYKRYPFDSDRFIGTYSTFRESIIKKVGEGNNLTPLEKYVFDELLILNESLNRRTYNALLGACFYNTKFFVDVDGRFHICEKMNPNFSIGDAENGFNIPTMKRITSDYIELIEKKCAACEIRHLCSRCYIHFAKDGSFEMPESFCQHQRIAIRKTLEYIIKINNIGGFDH